MRKKQEQHVWIAVFALTLLTVFFLLNPLSLNLPWSKTSEASIYPFPTAGQPQGNGVNPTTTPQINPNSQITLSIIPNVVNRAQPAQVSVQSNLGAVTVQTQVMYVGNPNWFNFLTIPLNANGGFSQSVPMGWAGVWKVRATYGSAVSNTVDLTVYGLTLYQSKTEWYSGESYTAALTGTYHSWTVYVYMKDAGSNTWYYVLSSVTDINGVILPNTNTVLIQPSQVGKDKNLIALICSGDSSGNEFADLFQVVQGTSMTTDQQISDFVGQGRIVESNILTVNIR